MGKTAKRFVIVALFWAVLSFAFTQNVSAADVSGNFTVTEAHLYRGKTNGYELSAENGVAAGTTFHAIIKWEYNSEMPIADGDTVSFNFGTGDVNTVGTHYTIRDSKDLDIISENDEKIGVWSVKNKKIYIKFSDASVGKYSLSGVISTAPDSYATSCIATDKLVKFIIADKEVEFTKLKSTSLGKLSDTYTVGNIATNGMIYHVYHSPGITMNEMYIGNGQTPLSNKAKFSSLSYEATFSNQATSINAYVFAVASIPRLLTDTSGGAAKDSIWLNITSLFRKKTQAAGQSYDDFYNSLSDREYGIYSYSDGRKSVAVKLGSQPSDITYAEAITASKKNYSRLSNAYPSLPEAADLINILDDPNNVAGGKVLHFAVQVNEEIPTSTTSATVVNTVKYDYENDSDESDYSKENDINISLGVATATINERELSDDESDEDAEDGNQDANDENNDTQNTPQVGSTSGTSGNQNSGSNSNNTASNNSVSQSFAEIFNTVAELITENTTESTIEGVKEIIDTAEVPDSDKKDEKSAKDLLKQTGTTGIKLGGKSDDDSNSKNLWIFWLIILLIIITYILYRRETRPRRGE